MTVTPKKKGKPRRDDVQLATLIPADLHARFKAWCDRRGLKMRRAVEQALRELMSTH
jgi:hypothetical protein